MIPRAVDERVGFEAPYCGYLLRFRPQPAPDGRFLAYVIVVQAISLRAHAALTPDLEPFVHRHDAALAGLRAGEAWVDESLSRRR